MAIHLFHCRLALTLTWAFVETSALADPLATLNHNDNIVAVAPYGPDTVP